MNFKSLHLCGTKYRAAQQTESYTSFIVLLDATTYLGSSLNLTLMCLLSLSGQDSWDSLSEVVSICLYIKKKKTIRCNSIPERQRSVPEMTRIQEVNQTCKGFLTVPHLYNDLLFNVGSLFSLLG